MRKQATSSKARSEARAATSSSDLAERAGDWLRALEREAEAHPLRTAGLAVGAGFVLGGGLFTPFMARTLAVGIRLAMRVAIVPVLTRAISTVEGQLLEGSMGFGSTTTTEGEDK
jgi:hypothetical protein